MGSMKTPSSKKAHDLVLQNKGNGLRFYVQLRVVG
jgi:hypothetical protein